MTSGFIQVAETAEFSQFATNIEQWPSSSRGELSAIVSALLTVPPNSEIIIQTDSKNTIDHFNKIEKTNFSLTPRQYFRQERNGIIWNILSEIIIKNKLNVELKKVKAHSDNVYNNYIDNLCKETHRNESIITFKNTDLYNIDIIPKWKNIRIDQKLRRFLTLKSNFSGFEEFYNLNRNGKYRITEIHWESTFKILNGDIENNSTNFESSNKKAMKVKFLIEELSTINQMKKSFLSLYENWLCQFCGKEEEHFDHIWTCQENLEILTQIREHVIFKLIEEIHKENELFTEENDILHISSIWNIEYSNDRLTFIDIIKGLIPLNLYRTINKHLNKSKTEKVLYNFRNLIYDEIMKNIWRPRCSYIKEIEKEYGITKKKKLDHKNQKNYDNIFRKVDDKNREENLEGLRNYIYFGGNIFDYYNVHVH